jgi:hypothetical protein
MRVIFKLTLVLILVLASLDAAAGQGRKYPPLSEHMMAPEAEVALARSAAPEKVSGRATIKILTAPGYKVVVQGDNGFVCMVMRSWTAPTFTPAPFRDFVYESKIRAPICFDPVASRSVLPYYELRTKLGMQGKDPEAIARGIAMAYAHGKLPKREEVSFAYMWSADQYLGPGIGAWRPHMMVFAPYYKNGMVGGNEFGGSAPQVTDDAGTPFTVVVIPVHGNPAIRAKAAGVRSTAGLKRSVPSVRH